MNQYGIAAANMQWIEANRKELEAVMRYTYEQGLVKRLGDFEDMFHPSTLNLQGWLGYGRRNPQVMRWLNLATRLE